MAVAAEGAEAVAVADRVMGLMEVRVTDPDMGLDMGLVGAMGKVRKIYACIRDYFVFSTK